MGKGGWGRGGLRWRAGTFLQRWESSAAGGEARRGAGAFVRERESSMSRGSFPRRAEGAGEAREPSTARRKAPPVVGAFGGGCERSTGRGSLRQRAGELDESSESSAARGRTPQPAGAFDGIRGYLHETLRASARQRKIPRGAGISGEPLRCSGRGWEVLGPAGGLGGALESFYEATPGCGVRRKERWRAGSFGRQFGVLWEAPGFCRLGSLRRMDTYPPRVRPFTQAPRIGRLQQVFT